MDERRFFNEVKFTLRDFCGRVLRYGRIPGL